MVSIVGVEMVFLARTLAPLLLGLGVCLSSLDRGRGTEEMVHVGVLWGAGGVLSGEAEAEAEVEAAYQDDVFHDEVGVSVEHSAEEEGCDVGSRVRSKGPLRVREGESDALELWGSAVEGCLACNMVPLCGGKAPLERRGHRDGGGHRGKTRVPLGNANSLGDDVNPQGEEGGNPWVEEGEEGEVGHTVDHLNETWICVDGRGPPSH